MLEEQRRIVLSTTSAAAAATSAAELAATPVARRQRLVDVADGGQPDRRHNHPPDQPDLGGGRQGDNPEPARAQSRRLAVPGFPQGPPAAEPERQQRRASALGDQHRPGVGHDQQEPDREGADRFGDKSRLQHQRAHQLLPHAGQRTVETQDATAEGGQEVGDAATRRETDHTHGAAAKVPRGTGVAPRQPLERRTELPPLPTAAPEPAHLGARLRQEPDSGGDEDRGRQEGGAGEPGEGEERQSGRHGDRRGEARRFRRTATTTTTATTTAAATTTTAGRVRVFVRSQREHCQR
jgi:hypothetical protein